MGRHRPNEARAAADARIGRAITKFLSDPNSALRRAALKYADAVKESERQGVDLTPDEEDAEVELLRVALVYAREVDRKQRAAVAALPHALPAVYEAVDRAIGAAKKGADRAR